MKKITFFLLILISFQSCVQKYKENKIKPSLDFSGDYIGTFSDIKNIQGKIELTLYQMKNGRTSGTIILKKEKEKENFITGIINGSSDGKVFNGNLTPSVMNYQIVSEDKIDKPSYDSYQCNWSLFGEIKMNEEITMVGKAVVMNCSESNIMEFTVTKVK